MDGYGRWISMIFEFSHAGFGTYVGSFILQYGNRTLFIKSYCLHYCMYRFLMAAILPYEYTQVWICYQES